MMQVGSAFLFALPGRTSARLAAGEIDADPLAPRVDVDDRPRPSSLRYGAGHGLGEGATRKRAAEGAVWR